MHIKRILQKILNGVMHAKQMETLICLVEAAYISRSVSLTELGRNINLKIDERSGIRRSDRFLGNKKVWKQHNDIVKQLIDFLIHTKKRPLILVDWSPVPNKPFDILRAALVAKGRALTLYEEIHEQEKENNPRVQKAFLKKLASLLPKDCKPIIVTDAGFCNPWFKAVLGLGWDFVGRVRGRKLFYSVPEEKWKRIKTLFSKATQTPKHIGETKLSKKNPLIVNLYLYKSKLKKRKALTRRGNYRHDKTSQEKSAAAREPWLLATSLRQSSTTAKKAVKIYSTRMQIEEGFRDLKSSKYGFGFEQMNSKTKERIRILMLIAAIASIMAWLTGYIAEKENLQFRYQASSIKQKRIISLFRLGIRIISNMITGKISKNIYSVITKLKKLRFSDYQVLADNIL